MAPFSNQEAFAILEQELGRPVSEVFSYISPVSISRRSSNVEVGCLQMIGTVRSSEE